MIPKFDLRDYAQDKSKFAHDLGRAFYEFGFVRIAGHEIPENILLRADRAAADFWALPDATKDQSTIAPLKGLIGYSRNSEKALGANSVDLKEEWSVRARMPAAFSGDASLNLPQNPLAVACVPHFEGDIKTLFHAFEDLTRRVMQPISLYMGESENWFDDKFNNSHSMMRLIHYPSGGNAAGHLDLNFLTWLRAEKPGLFVRARNGRDYKVTAAPGELLLNGGMQLGLLTNNDLKPSWHKVKATEPRDTIVFFVHPNPDFELSPLAKFAKTPPTKFPSYFPPRDEKGAFKITVDDFVRKEVTKIFAIK